MEAEIRILIGASILVASLLISLVIKKMWSVINNPSEVLEAINNAPEWDGSAIKYAPA